MLDMASDTRPVARLYRKQPTSDGAGVRLYRVIGSRALDSLDPFLLLDEFRSDSAADYVAGFPDHPHRGFETVTYMLAGRMRHCDNKGHSGLLRPGSVQWMTAGRGIVHSEMPEQEDGLMWGFQLWVNLPAATKMSPPHYQEFEPEEVPVAVLPGGVKVHVVAGKVADVVGPVAGIATSPTYLDVELPAGGAATIALPPGQNAFAYPFEGEARIGTPAQVVPRGTLAVLGDGGPVALGAEAPARLLLVAGQPLREPLARYGPFVMNTPEEIRRAIADYQSGRF